MSMVVAATAALEVAVPPVDAASFATNFLTVVGVVSGVLAVFVQVVVALVIWRMGGQYTDLITRMTKLEAELQVVRGQQMLLDKLATRLVVTSSRLYAWLGQLDVMARSGSAGGQVVRAASVTALKRAKLRREIERAINELAVFSDDPVHRQNGLRNLATADGTVGSYEFLRVLIDCFENGDYSHRESVRELQYWRDVLRDRLDGEN